MSPIWVDGGDPLPLGMVVEYLRSSMSNDLLCKFPDNSAFDFNYAQSSIWSPLLLLPNSSAAVGLDLSRLPSYGETVNQAGLLESTKKTAAKFKRRFTLSVAVSIGRCRKIKRKSFGFSAAVSRRQRRRRRLSLYSSRTKAWGKVMKAALKQFKKWKNNNNNKEPNVDLHLPSCFKL